MKTVLFILAAALIMLISSVQAQTAGYQFTTSPATNITQSSATISGFSSGSVSQTWVAINVGNGNVQHLGQINGAGQVTGNVTGLTCNTTYYFQVEGNVASGVTNGAPLSFTTLSCNGGGGTVQITRFSAEPVQVTNGGNTVLTWSSVGANACVIDGVTFGTSGSQSFGPIFGTRTYTLTCTGNNGFSDSRAVTISSGGAGGTVQLTATTGITFNSFTAFGELNVNLGTTSFTAAGDKVTLKALTYKVRECSPQSGIAIPFKNYTLSNGSTIISGVEKTVDQERLVTFSFGAGTIIRQNTSVAYTIHADTVSYAEAPNLNKKCFRMSLERSGVKTVKAMIIGDFPLRHNAETVVQSKPAVYFTAMGAITNRARTVNDDVAKLSVLANTAGSLMVTEVLVRMSTANGDFSTSYKLIDDATGVPVPGSMVVTPDGVFKFVMAAPEFVTAGGMKQYRVRLDSSSFPNTANGVDAVYFEIRKSSDFIWNTIGGDNFGLGLEDSQLRQQVTIVYE